MLNTLCSTNKPLTLVFKVLVGNEAEIKKRKEITRIKGTQMKTQQATLSPL